MATYTSVMRFIEPWSQNKELPFIRTNAGPGYSYTNFEWVDRSVQIRDARDQKETFNLDQHGFAYTDDIEGATPEMLDVLRDNDGERIREKYYPHIEALVKKRTGASHVVIFDHTSRKRRPELGTYENPTGKEQPATMVSKCFITLHPTILIIILHRYIATSEQAMQHRKQQSLIRLTYFPGQPKAHSVALSRMFRQMSTPTYKSEW
jgi:hypothetical protein